MLGFSTFRTGRLRLAIVAGAALSLVVTLLPGAGEAAPEAPNGMDYGFQGEGEARIRDVDHRSGRVAPTDEQIAQADRLGAHVRWNAFGTPHMMSNWTGYLSGPADGDAVDVARAWIAENHGLFRLTPDDVSALEVVRDAALHEAPDRRRVAAGLQPQDDDVAHAVLFRQPLGNVDASSDGLVGVGVDEQGRIISAWSSVTGDTTVTNTRRVSWREAYGIASDDVGRSIDTTALSVVDELTDEGFTTFTAPGTEDAQSVRPATVATPDNGVRLAWETVVLDSNPAAEHPVAFIHFVDAQTGEVLVRSNRVDHFGQGFDGGLAQSDDQEEGDGIPYWLTFPANPLFAEPPATGDSVEDTRKRWCWVPGPDCDRVIGADDAAGTDDADPAKPFAWDIDPRTTQSTHTTEGNNARTAVSEQSPFTPDTPARRPVSPTREYAFDWTNVWFESKCDPSNFQRADRNRNDEDAATANLFVGHNRMHDWGYYLGWTEENSNLQRDNFGKTSRGPYPTGREEDPETGQSQAGRGNPAFLGRDNANQITLQDGTPGITNQYLWQPLQAAFYPPCVDGAYDMSVVGHEVGHAIQNRMTGGPNGGLAGQMARAMGESWSDLTAVEYLNGYGFVPVADENPFAVGAYVTGDPWAAIRNYNMSVSPLNFSDIEYDGNGTTSPHADGEIWSAVNFDIRQALIDKFNDRFPAADQDLQTRCADGELAADQCPGNRRWVQMFHDAFLLQPRATSMLDARDAYLAADKMRFDGANQRLLWDVFAARGFGQDASTTAEDVCVGNEVFICDFQESGTNDRQPTPGWTSPLRDNAATITFASAPVGGNDAAENVSVYVGVYEARVTPVADTNPATDGETPADPEAPDGPKLPDISDTTKFAPGTYTFIAQAPGYGAFRFTETFTAGEERTVRIPLRRNAASLHQGAEASGDGGNLNALIDDTERTNWASRQEGPVQGKQVTVQLAGGRQTVRDLQVSAALRPAIQCPEDERNNPMCEPEDEQPRDDPEEPPYDTGGQNRFSALRAFKILTCDTTTGSACEAAEDFTEVYTSAPDAFPAIRPRPRAPELTLRPFDIPDTAATHVRIEVVDNQCTGGPDFQGDNNPDNDPGNDPDCVDGFSTIGTSSATGGEQVSFSQAENVRIAELQVFTEDEPFLGDPCGDAVQVAASYRDRPQARDAHKRSVDCVIYRNIAVGQDVEGQKFYLPLEDVTRGQMASFIVNDLVSAGYGDKLPSGQLPNDFNDIARDTHRVNINRLARADIVSGTGGGRYSPNAKVTREQMATFMMNAYRFAVGETHGDGRRRFDDVAAGNAHRSNIETGADLGLFSGRTSTRFAPAEPVKRDQMASFLINMFRRIVPQFD